MLCPRGWQELVAGALASPPCTSVAFDPEHLLRSAPEGKSWLTTYMLAVDDGERTRAELRARLDALAPSSHASELADLPLEFVAIPAEDYALSWRESWKSFRVGRLCVVPSWLDPQLRREDVRLLLDPGGAFGSGRHATTRACLRLLCERVRGGERVLDAGSGSGILAVSACLLGAREALGFDVDSQATVHAHELAAANSVAARARFVTAGFELLATTSGSFDVILANIYADVLVGHARDLARSLAPGGWFAFSGCTREGLDEVIDAAERAGLAVSEVRPRGRWHTIVGNAARRQ